MHIALFINFQKKECLGVAAQIVDFLKQKQIEVYAETEFCRLLHVSDIQENKQPFDFLISLGGDGTLLQLVHHYPHLKAPILGINMGGLGFMTYIPSSDIFPSLDDLLRGDFSVEPRSIVEGVSPSGEKFFAVNDVVIHRAINPSIVDLALFVDGHYLNTFSADGVIIATPNGSTAYSLAAGGPIVSPTLNCLVITPICPHTISNRPIVLNPKSTIRIEYLSEKKPVEVSYDGIAHFSMATHQFCHLFPSKHSFPLVNLKRRDYFATLRSKLGWTGKLRP